MLPNKDQISQPSKGRFFALTAGQVLNVVKTRSFKHSGYRKRIDIELRNLSSKSIYGVPVAAFYPGDALIVFSFPEDFGLVRAQALVNLAFEEFQSIDAKANPPRNRKESTSYRVYLGPSGELQITRRVRSATLAKYRGGAKFSNAFRPKKVDTSEQVVHVVKVA